jgi:DNA polymerase-1
MIELGAEIDHPAINGLLEYRKWAKYMSTYLKPWLAKMDENNRIHPKFKLHGTVTGRLSGEDGVHQVPRDKFIRSLIGSPPGWTFLEIDGSQIELRVASAISMEPTMLRIYACGGDIHRTTASAVTGIPEEDITGPDRKKAKAVNFGFLYGMGWKKFKIYAWEKYGVRLTDNEAKQFRERFFNLYSELPNWHKRMRNLVRKCGYVVSPIGRKRRLPNIYSVDTDMQASAEREAINSPVQGFGSDIVLGSFIDMVLNKAPAIDPNWRDTLRPVGAVHDAQYWEIRNDMLDFWAPKIKENFDDQTRLQKWFGYRLPIQMIGDIKIGNHWGDAHDWDIGQPLPFEMR